MIGTSWISGVDDDDTSHLASFTRFLDRPFELLDVQSPIVIFIQVITDLFHVVFNNRSRVERILRNRNHDSGARSTDGR